MGDIQRAWSQLVVVVGAVLGVGLLLAGCGGDGDGNSDTIWTGFSGIVILIALFFVVRHFMDKD